LLEPYAHWLHANHVLSDAQAWRQATSNAFLPEPL
jgi:NitT/TauT family transport system substrate-binding protein